MDHAEIASPAVLALTKNFSEMPFDPRPLLSGGDQIVVTVAPDALVEVSRFLLDDESTRFEQLIDVTCVDYLNFRSARDRYGVTYSLLSLSLEQRLWIKVYLNDPDPSVPSVTPIWKGAEWLEREVFDMFGIRFTGHPDLRRILTWDGFEPHPLRKDYPLRGRGEREDFPVLTRDEVQ
jgi:NADH-quinone oxidoreductase subunit C